MEPTNDRGIESPAAKGYSPGLGIDLIGRFADGAEWEPLVVRGEIPGCVP
jgi:hypothetical protein